jgi:hypothetical protein
MLAAIEGRFRGREVEDCIRVEFVLVSDDENRRGERGVVELRARLLPCGRRELDRVEELKGAKEEDEEEGKRRREVECDRSKQSV